MIHCRSHLINWLIKATEDDVLLYNAFRESGTRVGLLGTFDPLPGSKEPGWLVRVTTCRGRVDLIAIVKDYLGRPDRWYNAPEPDWDTWLGPSDDVLIGGDDTRTTIVHCKRDAYDILIDRTTKRGNPYIIGPDGNRDEVCDKHMEWLKEWIENKKEITIRGLSNKWQVEHLEELRGKRIACWCAPNRCHGDNSVRLLNDRLGPNKSKGRFDRIVRCSSLHPQEDKSAGDRKAGPKVVRKRSNPPNVPASIEPVIKTDVHNKKTN